MCPDTPAKEPATCPFCQTEVVPGSNADLQLADWVKSLSRRVTITYSLIAVGVILASGGKVLAYLAPAWAPWGHGLVGGGMAMALLSALFLRMLN